MLTVSYFYDLPLPSRFAATIQIVNTCRRLADLGAPTTVFAGPIRRANLFSFYGIDEQSDFRIVPLFSRIPGRPELAWRLRRIVRRAPSLPHVIMSRGETGVDLLPRVHRLRPPSGVHLVYEAHRLGFAREAERVLGQRWHEGDKVPAAAERIRDRERRAIHAADGIVALTPGVKRAIEDAFAPECPMLVLPSGVTLRQGRPARGPTYEADVIYAGKLERRKGMEVLLQAMRYLPGRRLKVLGGTGAQISGHQALAERLGIAPRVAFAGFIEPSRVADHLHRARVGVCPLPTGESAISEEFTSPLKLLELMANNVPVVASDLPTVRAIVEHRRSAILVPPDDPQALAEGIRTVLDEPGLAARLCAAAARRAADFSWETRAARLLEFLATLRPRRGTH